LKYKELLDTVVEKYAEFAKSKSNVKGGRTSQQIQKSTIKVVYSDKNETEYGKEVLELIKSKSKEFDFILYNIHHTYSFIGQKLVNLKKLISLETVKEYDKGVTKYIGYKDDSLIGIVSIKICVNINILLIN